MWGFDQVFCIELFWAIHWKTKNKTKHGNVQGVFPCSWMLSKCSASHAKLQNMWFRLLLGGGGGTQMARGGIRLVHGHTKSTLIRIFLGIKVDPKYAFLHAFFLICPSRPFQNLSLWPKTHPFSNFAHFCTPKRCTHVHCLILKNNPNYVNFWMNLIPPWHSSAPPAVASAGM